MVLALVAGSGHFAFAQTVPDQGPGGPILVINSPLSPFGKFYAEVLRNEGFNEFAVADVSNVTAAMLQNYDVVILAQMPLTSQQVQMLSNWVTGGGNLIAMRPDPALAGLLGIVVSGPEVKNGYLLIDTTSGSPGYGVVGETIQYFGGADRYTLNGATEVARLFTTADTPTANAAITIRDVGTSGGQAVAFAYDLATSLVYARQGNPAWVNQERDGLAPLRSNDLYYGASAADPQPDWVNRDKVHIPQADEQQRLLANLIQFVNKDRKPLPRFWYFPRDKKAVVVMTGDDHANNGTQGRFDQFVAISPPGCSVENWECVRGTSYLFPHTPLSPTDALNYAALGFEIGLHVSTGCANFTEASLESIYSSQIEEFFQAFPGLPPLRTQRHHCIAWSGWAIAPKVQYAHGMRLDTTYYYWPASWVQNRPGYMTGSAMPMRFVDLDGTLIDVYQAATHMTDESGQVYPFTADVLLDRALGAEGYFGAFTANMHTDVPVMPDSTAIVNSALARGVPVVSAEQLLRWLDGRNNSSFGSVARNGNTVTFTVSKAAGANGLRGYIPLHDANGAVSSIRRNGASIPFTLAVIKGIEYAFFDAEAGSYQVTYEADTTPPTIVAADPTPGAVDVSRFTTATATVSESLDPATVSASTVQMRDTAGALVANVVSYDPVARQIKLTPIGDLAQTTTYTVTVKGGSTGIRDLFGNPMVGDYQWSFTTDDSPDCPCGAFTDADVPSIPSVNDPASVELGVKFTVDVDGYVIGVRFFKGPGNTGTHTGSLWSAGGELLATAVFTAETETGWQQVLFDTPVPVSAGTVYIASYHAPNGHYAVDSNYFAASGVDGGLVNLLQSGVSGANGMFAYGSSTTFPVDSFQSSNYWVDVVFQRVLPPDTAPPLVTSVTPLPGASAVAFGTTVSATFNEAMDASSISSATFELRAPNGSVVPALVHYSNTTRTATLAPNTSLAPLTTYTVTVKGGPSGVRDLAGNPLTADHVWSFTTEAPDLTAPVVTSVTPTPGSTDVPRTATVTVSFSEPVLASTVNASTIELRDSAGALIPASVLYDAASNTASLVPSSALASMHTFTATVRGGAGGVLDHAGNPLPNDVNWSFTTGTTSVYTAWGPNATPGVAEDPDTSAIEVGVKFTVDLSGSITGIRFFKGPGNTGVHVGSLWTANGQLLAQATFTNETTTGWQQVNLPTPVPVQPGTVYVASYHAPNGRYASDAGFFAQSGVDAGPVNLLQDGVSGGNGVYIYSESSAFPTSSWNASNYWVDVVFVPGVGDLTAPTVTSVNPANGSSDVSTSVLVTAVFDEPVDPATITASSFELRDATGAVISAFVGYDESSRTAFLSPAALLDTAQTYTATVRGGATGVRDLAGNALETDFSWTFTTGTTSLFSVWGPNATPTVPAENDPGSVELGVKFTVDVPGSIRGIRFYKGPGNTGTHIGNLWTANGQLLASAVFVNETPTGWQQVTFTSPVAVSPGNVYVASYFAPNGHYATDEGYFATSGVDQGLVNFLQDGVSGGNGVFAYGSSSTFPTNSYRATNYWVDVVFSTASADTTPPSIAGVSPADGSTGIATTTSVSVTFDEPVDGSTVTTSTFELRDAGGTLVPASVTYHAESSTATLVPASPLAVTQVYTATVRGGTNGVRDIFGNALPADHSWSFTTSESQTYTAWASSTMPPVPAEDDPGAVELGVKFTVDVPGAITGVRFYKGPGNTGTHVANLWTDGGQLLASAVFTNETPTGWQQVSFGAPVPVTPGNVYVASYHAPNGHYASSVGYFANGGVDAGPVNLLQDGVAGPNGVYAYSQTSTFPTQSWQASNYWVDVIFTTSTVDTVAPSVTAVLPADGGVNVSAGTSVIARFNEPLLASSVNSATFELFDSTGALVPATVTYDAGSSTAALNPTDPLNFSETYTAVLRGGVNGIRDASGNALATDYVWSFTVEAVGGACTLPLNPIVAENCLPGSPQSEWDIVGIGDPSIQGFATEISVDQGETVFFKIDTDASDYVIDIYRLGYYGGLGARKVVTVTPSATLPQIQPECLSDPTTGLIDCGNWAISASWQVPEDATSGIYIARPKRTDTGGASHIVFVVRDDDSTSDLLFQTSDTTWQAYNTYGGNSLYVGQPVGRAYKVSYNRPFITRIVDGGQDWLFNSEYPMVRWLEANGYDVTYTTGVDTDRRGALLLNHRVFLSVGHDEYWSGQQRANVEAARNSGVHLAFFSGNEMFWKTRWEPSIDGSGQPYRTLVSYKETHANAIIDPATPTWTGTWRDPRFSPPSDGGRPENAVTGTIFMVNSGTTAIQVPAEDGKMRFWRNTSVADLPPGTVATLAASTLGYEWDVDLDNGWRPAGLIRLSTTTATDVVVLQDYGSTYDFGTATHHMTLYKHPSGALVFGAGTIQWSWGLDGVHDRGGSVPDIRMQQATVNLLADMGVQPATLQPGLFPATASTDNIAPTSSISTPAGGASMSVGSPVTISGTAVDAGGGVVGAVEVSIDGGETWHPANGRGNWSYTWTPTAAGSVNIRSRAVDDSGNIEVPGAGIVVTVH